MMFGFKKRISMSLACTPVSLGLWFPVSGFQSLVSACAR